MGSLATNAVNLEDSGQTEEINSGSHGAFPDFSTASTAYCHSSIPDVTDEDVIPINVNCDDRDLLHSNVETSTYSGDNVSNNRSVVNGGTSGFAGAILIVNASLGAGLLNFPAAFHEAGGVVAANLVQLVLLCFIFPGVLILSYCADWNGAKSLQEVMLFVFGRRAERACSICTAIYCFGTCITFLIIMGDQFDRLFASLYGHYFCHQWFLNRSFTTSATAILFILPFCYSKKIDFLKHISSVGVLAVIYVALLIIAQYYSGNYSPGDIKTSPASWNERLLVVPTLCFGYQCHVSTVPIYSCYKKRNMRTFTWSSFLALTLCVFTYTVAATYGYLTFGSKIASDILESYDANDPFILIAIIAISIKAVSTYPILSYCGCVAVCDLWVDSRAAQGVLQLDPRVAERFRLITVSIWFTLSVIFAVFMPDIGSVIKLLGSLAAVFIFICPGLCLLKMSETSDGYSLVKTRKLILLSAGLFLVVGAFLFGVVITDAIIYDFISIKSVEEPLCLPLPYVF